MSSITVCPVHIFPPPAELLVCCQPHRQGVMPGQKSIYETFLDLTPYLTYVYCIGGNRRQNYESLEGLAGEPDVLALHGGGAVHQEDQLGALGGAAEAGREGEEEEGGAVLSTALLHNELRASVVTKPYFKGTVSRDRFGF
jgi:hypothetical protein